MNPKKQPARLDELDGLRGCLALWVVVSHIFCWTGFWTFKMQPWLKPAWIEFVSASAAVETFIILSGFAISFLIRKQYSSYFHFITGRFFRIYPVFFVCLMGGVAVSLFLTPEVINTAKWGKSVYFDGLRSFSASETSAPLQHTFSHLALVHGIIPRSLLKDSSVTLLAPAWSISLEWQYYLLAPLIAWFARTGTGLIFLAGLSWLSLRFSHLWANPHLAFLPLQLPLFLIGIGSYHLYELYVNSPNQRSRFYAVPAAIALAISILGQWHSLALALWALGFGCIFVKGNDLFSRGFSGVRALLLNKWAQRLGKISYPIYVVHWPMIIIFLAGIFEWRPKIPAIQALWLLLLLGLPLILLAGFLLHIVVERPFMTFGKRLSNRGKTAKNSAGPSENERSGN